MVWFSGMVRKGCLKDLLIQSVSSLTPIRRGSHSRIGSASGAGASTSEVIRLNHVNGSEFILLSNGYGRCVANQKTGESQMKYKIAIQETEEGFSVSVPGLPGCWSQGVTEEEALENIQDAIREYLAARDELLEDAVIREIEVVD